MTSSEDNRVSIPPKRSGIGLSDHRSCVASQKLPFLSVVLCRVFAGNRHRYINLVVPIVRFCSRIQVLCVFLQHNHVKSYTTIFGFI